MNSVSPLHSRCSAALDEYGPGWRRGRATHGDLAADAVLPARLPELAAVRQAVGNIRAREWGTVGGNLAADGRRHDLPAFLSALGAAGRLVSITGSRCQAIQRLCDGPRDRGPDGLRPGELLHSVEVPSCRSTSA